MVLSTKIGIQFLRSKSGQFWESRDQKIVLHLVHYILHNELSFKLRKQVNELNHELNPLIETFFSKSGWNLPVVREHNRFRQFDQSSIPRFVDVLATAMFGFLLFVTRVSSFVDNLSFFNNEGVFKTIPRWNRFLTNKNCKFKKNLNCNSVE